MLGRLRQLQQGPALADDGTLLGRWRRSDVVGQAAAEGMPPLFFLNLSNHPVACWSPAQLVAARALGLGEPADLPGGMPLVPAAAGEREVARLAEELLERLGEAKVELGGACVSGEFTLTATLLRLLQRCGVRCFAATTERQVRERIEADGSVKRESEFRFVRWREYPGG